MEKITIKIDEKIKSEIIFQEDLTKNIKTFFQNKKYFLITNETIGKIYPDFLSNFDKNNIVIIKDGEEFKNINTFNYIIENLLSKKIERKDCIVALGGGVVGDLAGFVASSILRGVELIQVPTTLLAMCDSSIGGKTGFNSKFGKNLIGSFYLASKVLIDKNFIKTLDNYQYNCGLGEVVKYAFIEKSCKSKKYFNMLDFLLNNTKEEIKQNIDFIIKASAALKASVVNQDKNEGGLRKILNFGHTFAHPIETIYNYKNITHGEAVSFGIKYASKLAYNLSLIDKNYLNQINEVIDKLGLCEKKISFDKKQFLELMTHDKKVLDNKINLILPNSKQTVEIFDNIDLPSIEAFAL